MPPIFEDQAVYERDSGNVLDEDRKLRIRAYGKEVETRVKKMMIRSYYARQLPGYAITVFLCFPDPADSVHGRNNDLDGRDVAREFFYLFDLGTLWLLCHFAAVHGAWPDEMIQVQLPEPGRQLHTVLEHVRKLRPKGFVSNEELQYLLEQYLHARFRGRNPLYRDASGQLTLLARAPEVWTERSSRSYLALNVNNPLAHSPNLPPPPPPFASREELTIDSQVTHGADCISPLVLFFDECNKLGEYLRLR
ncbi:hypothetical protein B7494_g3523 [Chlorociboria aeruginascens]|nr:hypothetical protein B7494_g3523 [Chlorociboria aeruginascens]